MAPNISDGKCFIALLQAVEDLVCCPASELTATAPSGHGSATASEPRPQGAVVKVYRDTTLAAGFSGDRVAGLLLVEF